MAALDLDSIDVTMNMVWIYKKSSHQERLVFPERPHSLGRQKVSGDYFSALHLWSQYFQPVHVWYDGQLVGPKR